MAIKRAIISAETVAVLCPHCGDSQPAEDGSEQWTKLDVENSIGNKKCTSCDTVFILSNVKRVMFE